MSETWLPDLQHSAGAKYLAIAEAIGAAIDKGILREGDRLPPQRELAERLGVDLTTVTKAYDRARTRGMIAARGRAGSFILAPASIPAGPPPIDTGMNMPPEVPGGLLTAAWERTTAALLRAPGALARLHYQPAGGLLADRQTAVHLFASLGLSDAAEARAIVTAGAQNALQAIVGSSLQSGDVVACGRFTYPGFIALARRHGLKLAPLEQIDADALRELCRREPVRALYVVPTNDNPTTRTIAAAERGRIAEVCRNHGIMLIEDDAYGALASTPIPPIAAALPGQSWYIASSAKAISPALRVAFVHCPGLSQAHAAAGWLHQTAIMPPPLNVALVTAWLKDGTFARLVEGTRAESHTRLALASRILPAGSFAANADGYHLWLPVPSGNMPRIADSLRRCGLTAIPSDSFAPEPALEQALRISLGGPITREELAHALTVLAAQLDGEAAAIPMV